MIYPSGTPTKPEIIEIALSKLNITKNDVFADIGCGSGSVSIKASKLANKVYAIDKRDGAINATQNNLKECGINNVTVLKGDAVFLIPDLEINCAFIGGSKNIKKLLEIVIKKVPCFVVSAVRIETLSTSLNIMKKNHSFKELLQIQLSRGYELKEGTMFKPDNPVYLIFGGKC